MRQRGFTLIELVVTMTVLALLLLAAVPSLGRWLDNTRIRNVTESLQGGLQLARSEAIRRNQNISFWLVELSDPALLSADCTLSPRSGSWVVSVYAPTRHCADAPSTDSSPMLVSARPVGDAGGNVTVVATQGDGSTPAQSVSFDGFGRVTNPDAIGQIDVTGNNPDAAYRNMRIAVSTAGLVRMCDPRVTLATDPRRC